MHNKNKGKQANSSRTTKKIGQFISISEFVVLTGRIEAKIKETNEKKEREREQEREGMKNECEKEKRMKKERRKKTTIVSLKMNDRSLICIHYAKVYIG